MGARKFAYVIHRLTFPNGKIYIGMDIGGTGHSLRYFGSWNNALVEADFEKSELADFSLRKEIIFESHDKAEVRKREVKEIVAQRANDPAVGYNRFPKLALLIHMRGETP